MTKEVDYFSIIHKYISTDSKLYPIYLAHVYMVTAKALTIGNDLGLSADRLKFIEEASMLHDIGIFNTNVPEIGCYGNLPYIAHVTEGKALLEAEGLPLHARVAGNHIGVGGVSASEIEEAKLPLPKQDLLCESEEEFIISYSDLFFSKKPEQLFYEIPVEKVLDKVKSYGERQTELFISLHEKYTQIS